MNFINFTQKSLTAAINEFMKVEYKGNVRKIREFISDRMSTSLETAVDNIEYFINCEGFLGLFLKNPSKLKKFFHREGDLFQNRNNPVHFISPAGHLVLGRPCVLAVLGTVRYRCTSGTVKWYTYTTWWVASVDHLPYPSPTLNLVGVG